MGALHAGHEKLMETARGEITPGESGVLAVSIFVNPIQFGPNEDYGRYPRALPQDLEMCERNGVDLVFAPSVDEMYPSPQLTFTEVTRVGENLCGKFRPGHFRGVATVVLKLLNIVQPQRAYFGEKDMQQLAVIRRMVSDLNIPVTIVGVPTVREPDGLALSSRNKYLNEEERNAAPLLYRSLQEAASLIVSGERDVLKVREAALALLNSSPLIRVEYLEIVDPDELQPVSTIDRPARIASAIWLGTTRLIDNIPVLADLPEEGWLRQ
jgi:pantoate--beta-alanine ligase